MPAGANPGTWEYSWSDALGSVHQIADANGNVTLAESYEPYGAVVTSTGSASTIFGFAGEVSDANNVIYLRARYMRPKVGIFFSHDPVSGDVLQPESMNGYSYGLGNPVNSTDPNGLCPKPPTNMLPAICLALFIKPDRVPVAGGMWILHGDGRDFSIDSDRGASRGFIWIQTQENNYAWVMNKTGYIAGDIYYGPGGSVEVMGPGHEHINWAGPSDQNRWGVTRVPGGSGEIEVSYDLVLAGPLENIAPHINGSITFYRRADGNGLSAFGPIDGFPWVEAYYWNSVGNVQTIFQQSAIDSNSENLNNIEPLHDVPIWAKPCFYLLRDLIFVNDKYRGVKTYIDTAKEPAKWTDIAAAWQLIRGYVRGLSGH